jgi:hypothetical protein
MKAEQLIGQRLRLMQELDAARQKSPQPMRLIARLSRDLATAERLLALHECQTQKSVAVQRRLAA